MSSDRSRVDAPSLRIDKWLWFVRFFKTRSLAARAVSGGHVRLNGSRIKPSHVVVVGDVLKVQRGTDLLECRVEQLPQRRGSAAEAGLCYAESEESLARRAMRETQRKAMAAVLSQPTTGRPDKRTRRMLRERFRGSRD